MLRIPQATEVEQRTGVAVAAIMLTATAVGIQPGTVGAFITFISLNCFIKTLKLACKGPPFLFSARWG